MRRVIRPALAMASADVCEERAMAPAGSADAAAPPDTVTIPPNAAALLTPCPALCAVTKSVIASSRIPGASCGPSIAAAAMLTRPNHTGTKKSAFNLVR